MLQVNDSEVQEIRLSTHVHGRQC